MMEAILDSLPDTTALSWLCTVDYTEEFFSICYTSLFLLQLKWQDSSLFALDRRLPRMGHNNVHCLDTNQPRTI